MKVDKNCPSCKMHYTINGSILVKVTVSCLKCGFPLVLPFEKNYHLIKQVDGTEKVVAESCLEIVEEGK